MKENIKVLMTGYEVAPFFKRGGLGDVLGSLPKALLEIKVDARVVVPYYEAIREKYKEEKIGEFNIHFGEKEEQISIYKGYFPKDNCSEQAGVVYFLSNKPNLSYINTHGRNKKIDQFAFFDLAVAHFINWLRTNKKWTPDIVHCNDWQTALIPLILKSKVGIPIPTLLTIHNLAYQGWGSRKVLNLLHLRDEDTKELKHDKPVTEINILGEGILHATRVSTVSPTYAAEISNSNSRELIYHYLKRREEEKKQEDGIVGIANGIDCDVWNPVRDQFINHKFDVTNWEMAKKANKEDLIKEFSLNNKPTFCFVGRLAKQKGLDILTKAVNRLVALGLNIIILGSGDPNIEKSITRIVQKYPNNVKAEFTYSEELAHRLYAASDFILIPSHYEPCGLIQMIGMKYGTLPLASKTGGLRDSIKNNSNGFLFEKDSKRSLIKTVKKALRVYKDESKYEKMVERAMKTDFTWNKSAKKYKQLYLQMLNSE